MKRKSFFTCFLIRKSIFFLFVIFHANLEQNVLFYWETESSSRPSGVIFLEGSYCDRVISVSAAGQQVNQQLSNQQSSKSGGGKYHHSSGGGGSGGSGGGGSSIEKQVKKSKKINQNIEPKEKKKKSSSSSKKKVGSIPGHGTGRSLYLGPLR